MGLHLIKSSQFHGFSWLFANEFALGFWGSDGFNDGKFVLMKSYNMLLAGCLFEFMSLREFQFKISM